MSYARDMNERLLRGTFSAWRAVLSPLLTDVVAERSGAWPVVEGLASRLEGQRVEFELGGATARGVLESVALDRHHDQRRTRLRLVQFEWDGLRFEALSVVAQSVALTPPPDVVLTAAGVELAGRSPLGPLVAWLDGRLPEWRLGVTRDGLVEAVPQGGRGERFEVVPLVLDGELEVELRAVRWGGVRLRFPTWLRLVRKVALPALPEGLTIVEARCRGTGVDLRLSVPSVSRRVGPGLRPSRPASAPAQPHRPRAPAADP